MRWVTILVVLVLLAGCAGKNSGANQVKLGDGSRLALDLPADQQPDKEDIRGAVSGVVVNDAIYPVQGARVQVKGWNFTMETPEDGRFSFLQMPPGLYVLQVNKAGHADSLGTLNVKSGEVAKSVLMLPRLPFVAPYHLTQIIDEFHIEADRYRSGYNNHILAVDGPPMTFIVEAKWDSLTRATGDPLAFYMKPERRPVNQASTGTGPNPLRVVFEADAFAANEYAVRVDVRPTALTLPPESKGRLFVTAFYLDPAPDGWSFVRGDT